MKKDRIPYEDTTVSTEKSQKEINDLLAKYGITKKQWTSSDGVFYQLAFIHKEENNREIGFKIRIDVIKRKTKMGEKLLPEATLRLLFYFIKTKLEAVKFGVETIEEAFMPYIAIGPTSILKDVYLKQLPRLDEKYLLENE